MALVLSPPKVDMFCNVALCSSNRQRAEEVTSDAVRSFIGSLEEKHQRLIRLISLRRSTCNKLLYNFGATEYKLNFIQSFQPKLNQMGMNHKKKKMCRHCFDFLDTLYHSE
jgi:hypothetical protein